METLTFRSDDLPAKSAFEAYHELYRNGSDVARIGETFAADIKVRRFPRMLVFDRKLAGLSHERTARRVSSDGFDHIMLQLVMTGEMTVSTDDTSCIVEAGSLVTFDLLQPQRTWTEGARIATVSIARDIVQKTMPLTTPIHGRVFPACEAPLVSDLVRSLVRCDAAMDTGMADAATLSVGTFLGALLGSGLNADRDVSSSENTKIKTAMGIIESNIGRSDLSAEIIADSMGVSRSVLYRIFEPFGGVARCIRHRRLVALRKALAYPGESRSIAVVARACGFISDAHANRSFRQEFGMTPGEFRVAREQDRGLAGLPDHSDPCEFSRWFRDLM